MSLSGSHSSNGFVQWAITLQLCRGFVISLDNSTTATSAHTTLIVMWLKQKCTTSHNNYPFACT